MDSTNHFFFVETPSLERLPPKAEEFFLSMRQTIPAGCQLDILKPQTCNFNKKGTLAQVFSCEYREILKNTFFTEHFWTTTSVYLSVINNAKYHKKMQEI